MFKKIRNLILAGLLVVLPLGASVYIIWFIFIHIDRWTRPVIEILLGREIPGVGIIFTFLIIFLAGLFTTNIIGKKIIRFGENILMRIPLFRNIYISIKKVLEALFTSKTGSFKKPILFEYPRKGLYQVGFLTRDHSPYFDSVTGRELYNVFLPTTPNPTSGMFILVPREEAVVLDISVEEALKLIISGGILSPRILAEAATDEETFDEETFKDKVY